jgi:hypothetical protein
MVLSSTIPKSVSPFRLRLFMVHGGLRSSVELRWVRRGVLIGHLFRNGVFALLGELVGNFAGIRQWVVLQPMAVVACHCIACQKRSGSPFGEAAYYPHEQVKVCGEARKFTRATDAGSHFDQFFCPDCGMSTAEQNQASGAQ